MLWSEDLVKATVFSIIQRNYFKTLFYAHSTYKITWQQLLKEIQVFQGNYISLNNLSTTLISLFNFKFPVYWYPWFFFSPIRTCRKIKYIIKKGEQIWTYAEQILFSVFRYSNLKTWRGQRVSFLLLCKVIIHFSRDKLYNTKVPNLLLSNNFEQWLLSFKS